MSQPNQPLIFDEHLIQKYNRSGPRYTSYPTALEFTPIGDGVESDILATRDSTVPLSLYFHIPFCRHLCYYCGCNKIITKKNADSGDYLTYLFREIRHKKSLLKGNPIVEQLHFGGGTPTFLSDDELIALWQFLNNEFEFSKTGDFGIEIDPRELRPNTLKILKELGFNRLSFGVQDLNETVQIAVNRVQSYELICEVMTTARALGFDSINIDLIYGLPHQNQQSFADTVANIIALSPDRLSVFNYAHLPARFPAQKRICDDDLPSPQEKLSMFGQAITQLNQAGYHYIGIDHFAKPDDELARLQKIGKLHRNFQGYTTRGDCDLLGFGVSSISQIGAYILQNDTDLTKYKEKIDAGKMPAIKVIKADPKDELRRFIIMNILCHDVIDFEQIYQKFGVDKSHFVTELNELNKMADDGLLSISDNKISVLPKGRLLGRNIAMVFDEYLNNKEGKFSRVI